MKECAAVCLPARRCPREQLNSTPPLLGWWSTRWPAATLLTTSALRRLAAANQPPSSHLPCDVTMRWCSSGPVWLQRLPFASRCSHAARSLHLTQAAAFRVSDARSGGCTGNRQRMAAVAEDFAGGSHSGQSAPEMLTGRVTANFSVACRRLVN